MYYHITPPMRSFHFFHSFKAGGGWFNRLSVKCGFSFLYLLYNNSYTPILLSPLAHRLQLASKVLIHDQVDEEVGQVVDGVSEAKISADFSGEKRDHQRGERENKDQEQTHSNLHRLHVASFPVDKRNNIKYYL